MNENDVYGWPIVENSPAARPGVLEVDIVLLIPKLRRDIYALLPPLSQEEYGLLKGDIASRGVMVPIELDRNGEILDGKHRLRACKELGIPKVPIVTRSLLAG